MNTLESLGFPTVIYNTLSLEELARLAVGEENVYNISMSIPFGLLKHTKGDSMMVVMYPRLVPCPDWVTAKKAARLLMAQGYILGNISELVQFTAQYPQEVAKYSAVLALDEDSRWNNSDTDICVPFVTIDGSKRCLRGYRIDHLLSPEDSILVFEKEKVSHRPLVAAPPPVL